MAEFQSHTVAITTILVLLAIMALSAFVFKPPLDNSSLVIYEEPITKSKELQLQPGETYVYSYFFNSTQINITYDVFRGMNCTAIRIAEMGRGSESCIDRWGMDNSSSNSSLQNPSMLLFKPWMLALKEGWHWNNSVYLAFGENRQHIADVNYRVLRMENYRGRLAFVVLENASDGGPQYDWVDDEKRVLLKTMGEGYEVVLVEGIPLD